MISTLLVLHPWLTTAALAAAVLLGPFVGAWLARRPRVAWVLAGAALLPVLALTLVPTGRAVEAVCVAEWSVPTLGRVELMANLVLLVPPVLAAAVASRRPLLALLAGSGLSVLIEAAQALLPALGRSCSTNDWLSNTLGAVLGALLAVVALRLAARRAADLGG